MSKESRRIKARGLTASSRGSTIFWDGRTYGVDGVRYDDGVTIVKFTGEVYIPNNEEVEVFD